MPSDYLLVAKAIGYLDEHALNQPGLAEIADHVGLSPYHFQRLFKRWVGISPKRFLQLLTIQRAKAALVRPESVLDAAYESGLSSPGRLHDLFVSMDAVTPGEYKARGHGLEIRTGVHDSPFGHCLIAVTERGVCGMSFHDDPACRDGMDYLRSTWPSAEIAEDLKRTASVADAVFGGRAESPQPITLCVKGTNFQVKVWEALLGIGAGSLTTYGDIASRIGNPGASRAVGAAVGRNPVSYLIPCHRVITSLGTFGNYRWGPVRKKAIIGYEWATLELADTK